MNFDEALRVAELVLEEIGVGEGRGGGGVRLRLGKLSVDRLLERRANGMMLMLAMAVVMTGC